MRRLVAAAAIIAALVGIVPAATAASDPNAYTRRELYITSGDGTKVRTTVFRPAHFAGKTPVILNVSPYNGSGGAFGVPPPLPIEKDLPELGNFAEKEHIFQRGYSFVRVELRGDGGSGGCYDWGGKGERADVKAAVEWSAKQPWSTGKVGMIGHSSDGWTGLQAIREKPKGLAAVITESPPSGYLNYFSNGVRTFGNSTVFASYYAASDLWPPGVFAAAEEWQQALVGSVTHPTCYASVVAGSYNADRDSPYWQERESATTAIGTKVPVMFVQGFNDYNVRPTNFIPYYGSLDGPRRAVLGPWWHGYPLTGTRFYDEEMSWFDKYLKGLPVSDTAPVQVQDANGRWRTEEDFPAPDVRRWPMKLKPGTYINGPGNNSETALPDAFPVPVQPPLPTGRGTWTFTQPLPYDARMSGWATMHAKIAMTVPLANIIPLVYDVDPKGNAVFVERGSAKATGPGTYNFDLYPQDWLFQKGHRIGVLLTGADDFWFEPSGAIAPVVLEQGTLTFPFVRTTRTTTATGPMAPRKPYAPFDVSDKIASATVKQAMPPAMVARIARCNPHDSDWWAMRAAQGGTYGVAAARAAQRSYGLFADATSVTRALAGGGTRAQIAAYLLDLAGADLGPQFNPRVGLEPGSKLSSSTYNTKIIGDTARGAAYWLSRNASSPYSTDIVAKLLRREGVSCS